MGCAAGVAVHPENVQRRQRPNGQSLMPMKQTAGPKPLRKPQFALKSSWDSTTWRGQVPSGVPRPPGRSLHEKHLNRLDLFRKNVEIAPDVFSDIVTARRQASDE
ncbi:unnamed protein product [Symbiodinium natans]|uniref:Uncharacterized protein n=1 Tax=Symbiodinium natans TaxID=878477 RepID=A0A812GEL1_9DINO|nr:unnamed protein product [Symbiodinium natans]